MIYENANEFTIQMLGRPNISIFGFGYPIEHSSDVNWS